MKQPNQTTESKNSRGKIYYIYLYLNPLKRGIYSYNEISEKFNEEPFYVGLGSNNRHLSHLKAVEENKISDKNHLKNNIIKKILNNGFQPTIIKIIENLTYIEAINNEKKYIKNIGRRTLKLGPLSNISPGGTGGDLITGHPKRNAIVKKISKSLKNKKITSSHKEKISKTLKENYKEENFSNKNKKILENARKVWSKKLKIRGGRGGANNPTAKKYKLTSPNNESFFVHGTLKQFIKDHNLSGNMISNGVDKGIIKINPKSKKKTINCLNTVGWLIESL